MNIIPSTGINFGFTAADVFNNTELIVGGLAAFVLVYLGVRFSPDLIGILKGSFEKDQGWDEHGYYYFSRKNSDSLNGDYVKSSRLRHYFQIGGGNGEDFDTWSNRYLTDLKYRKSYNSKLYGD